MLQLISRRRCVTPFMLVLAVLLALNCGSDSQDSADTQKQAAVASGNACGADGSSAAAADGCNSCVCEKGAWACTEKACAQTCTDGESKPAEDGCNTCTCSMGQWACTARGCGACPPPRESSEICTEVLSYARDPAGGSCCEYGTPCMAPEGWTQHSTMAECEQGAPGLAWYPTCGDPVCGPPGPSGATPCTVETEGSSCEDEGALCDAELGCGSNLVCASSDPRMGPGGCPVSRAAFKRDIRYVDSAQRRALAEELLRTPLATWRYRNSERRPQLGFILEDMEPSFSVDTPRDQVDLYGTLSMAVAALQEQDRQLRQLRQELEALGAAQGRQTCK